MHSVLVNAAYTNNTQSEVEPRAIIVVGALADSSLVIVVKAVRVHLVEHTHAQH